MAPRKKKAAPGSEAALCNDFIALATKDKTWAAYGETGGWDILLVRKADGFQIGIEAKLALNNKVVTQALPHRWWHYADTGPDCRAVLVPEGTKAVGLETICGWLGLTVITLRAPAPRGVWYAPFDPQLPTVDERWDGDAHWHEWCPVNRVPLPDYLPDVATGVAAPVQLTAWKVKAIKLAIVLESRPVTRRDFKALHLDPSRWTDRHTGWLVPTSQGYVRSGAMPDFKVQHPVVYEQIKADAGTWLKGELAGEGTLFGGKVA